MPEGNTIHRLARAHTRDFAGRRIAVSSPQGRFASEARRLDGRRFLRADAYGKHLFHHWSGGLVVHERLESLATGIAIGSRRRARLCGCVQDAGLAWISSARRRAR